MLDLTRPQSVLENCKDFEQFAADRNLPHSGPVHWPAVRNAPGRSLEDSTRGWGGALGGGAFAMRIVHAESIEFPMEVNAFRMYHYNGTWTHVPL